MTVLIDEDPALPEAEIDECEAVIACLGDDAALLRRENPDCEIAANMDAAADMLEKLRATEEGAKEAFGHVVQDKRDLEAECKRLRELLAGTHAQIRSFYMGTPEARLAAALKQRDELRHEATRALVAWDGTVLPKAHDGLMQERMECLRAALADLGA
jgi:hypothetical protein